MNNIIVIYALLIVISALSLLGIVVVVAKAIIIGVGVKKYNTVSEYKAKVRFYSIGKGVKRANSMSHEEILAKLMYMIKRNSKGRGYYDYYLLLIYFPSVLFFSWKYPLWEPQKIAFPHRRQVEPNQLPRQRRIYRSHIQYPGCFRGT